MRKVLVAGLTLVALALAGLPTRAASSGEDARLEGLVIGVDGRPAVGWQVQLVGEEGRSVATAAAGHDGLYAFAGLPAGEYTLGVESPAGAAAPVAAPPLRLAKGTLARRDVKLVETTVEGRDGLVQRNYGLGTWWAGLSTASKSWTIVGLVAVTAITVSAIDSSNDSNNNEPPATPTNPAN